MKGLALDEGAIGDFLRLSCYKLKICYNMPTVVTNQELAETLAEQSINLKTEMESMKSLIKEGVI